MKNIYDYLKDPNLTDGECRIIVVIKILAKDKNYVYSTNKEIGELSGKSQIAISKIVHLLCKKEYLKNDKDKKNRRLNILK